ncbi:hypothetical protein MAR_036947 [Mya arenaria]|uniref:Uncharacterized protein n=1 Tax=Mya arenaria TaxID=6604 RepID=A0ABY7FM27_MYAAR|nr:hypothetical protein MAR_036947 [Mya arenaria]
MFTTTTCCTARPCSPRQGVSRQDHVHHDNVCRGKTMFTTTTCVAARPCSPRQGVSRQDHVHHDKVLRDKTMFTTTTCVAARPCSPHQVPVPACLQRGYLGMSPTSSDGKVPPVAMAVDPALSFICRKAMKSGKIGFIMAFDHKGLKTLGLQCYKARHFLVKSGCLKDHCNQPQHEVGLDQSLPFNCDDGIDDTGDGGVEISVGAAGDEVLLSIAVLLVTVQVLVDSEYY